MKQTLIPLAITAAAIAFAGCQTQSPATTADVNLPSTKTSPAASSAPKNTPSSSPVAATAEDKELQSIEQDLNSINLDRDFPGFTNQDLEQ